MRTTITLDDALVEAARDYTGIKETSALVREALTTLVQLEAGRRLAAMGGSMPDLKLPRRGRYFTPDGRWVSTEDAQSEPEDED